MKAEEMIAEWEAEMLTINQSAVVDDDIPPTQVRRKRRAIIEDDDDTEDDQDQQIDSQYNEVPSKKIK